MQALDFWSSVSNLNFIQNTVIGANSIINIGTGDLAALGFTSAPGGTLGLGGANFSHGSSHSVSAGIAWMDKDENWDDIFNNGNPGGTFDWFTVVAQEIGHALGLGHTNDIAGADMMDGTYSGEQTVLSSNDVEHITSVYGSATVVPIPPAILLFGSGILGLLGLGRHRNHRGPSSQP